MAIGTTSSTTGTEQYDFHKGKYGAVIYTYDHNFMGDPGYAILKGSPAYVQKDFLTLFNESVENFNKAYRVYMENLYKKRYTYDLASLPGEISYSRSSQSHKISVVTDDMAHAFGLPSTGLPEITLRNDYLSLFFNDLVVKEGDNYTITHDDSNTYGYIASRLVDVDADTYTAVKSDVSSIISEVRRLKNYAITLELSASDSDIMKQFDEQLIMLGNLIYDDSSAMSLKSLCTKYRFTKGLNAFLLKTLLECSEVYREILSHRNSKIITYDLQTQKAETTELFIDSFVSHILYYLKEKPENLKNYLNCVSDKKKFMDFVQPFILNINVEYVPHASLGILNAVVENNYENIVNSVRQAMVQSYIMSKDTSEIVVDASKEKFLADEKLCSEVNDIESNTLFLQSLQSEFLEYCNDFGEIPKNNSEKAEMLLLYITDLKEKGKFKIEHWKFLASYKFSVVEEIRNLKENLETLEEKKDFLILKLAHDKNLAVEEAGEELLYDDELGIEIINTMDKLERSIKANESIIVDIDEELCQTLNFYQEILIERHINDTTSLDDEIDKFKRANAPKLKGNAKVYPILFSFFNGVNNRLPVYDGLEKFKVYGGRTKRENDVLFQNTFDLLFQLEEMLRTSIFVEDLENTINRLNNDLIAPIKKEVLLKRLSEVMYELYDYPYLHKKMLDDSNMRDRFKQDFIDGKKTINWKRVSAKSEVVPRISSAFLRTPMIKRIDGKILSDFRMDDKSQTIVIGDKFERKNEQTLGYFFQLPNSATTADLVYIEPTFINGEPVFKFTHFFSNQPFVGPVTKVIVRDKNSQYSLEDLLIPSGSIISHGTKLVDSSGRTRTSFNRNTFFPDTMEKHLDSLRRISGATVSTDALSLAGLPADLLRLFELMVSSNQLMATTSSEDKKNLEIELLGERIKQLESNYTLG